MNYQQEIQINQSHHSISFFAYDIVKIERYEIGMESVNYVAECAYHGSYVGYKNEKCLLEEQNELQNLNSFAWGITYRSNKCEPKLNRCKACIKCNIPHFNEIYIDGFSIDVNDYNWEDRPYIATLQTGIRVPVTKEIYDAWVKGFETDWFSGEPIIIENK